MLPSDNGTNVPIRDGQATRENRSTTKREPRASEVVQGDLHVNRASKAIGEISNLTLSAASGVELRANLVHALQSLISSEDVGVTSAAAAHSFQATLLGQRTEHLQTDDGWRYVHEFPRPVVTRFAQGFTRCSEIFGSAERSRLTCVREYFSPKGLDRTVTRFWALDGQLFTVGLARQRMDFSDTEVTLLDSLFPHVAVAMRMSVRLAQEDTFTAFCDNYDLSLREREIAQLVARGLRNVEIATLLHLRPNTVRNYIAALFRRARVSSRAELTFLMYERSHGAAPSGRQALELLNWMRESARVSERNPQCAPEALAAESEARDKPQKGAANVSDRGP